MVSFVTFLFIFGMLCMLEIKFFGNVWRAMDDALKFFGFVGLLKYFMVPLVFILTVNTVVAIALTSLLKIIL